MSEQFIQNIMKDVSRTSLPVVLFEFSDASEAQADEETLGYKRKGGEGLLFESLVRK